MKKIISVLFIILVYLSAFSFSIEYDPMNSQTLGLNLELPFNLYIHGSVPLCQITQDFEKINLKYSYILDGGISRDFYLFNFFINAKIGPSYQSILEDLTYPKNPLPKRETIFGLAIKGAAGYKINDSFSFGVYYNLYNNFYKSIKSLKDNKEESFQKYSKTIEIGIFFSN